jgi:hypothetical protein
VVSTLVNYPDWKWIDCWQLVVGASPLVISFGGPSGNGLDGIFLVAMAKIGQASLERIGTGRAERVMAPEWAY